jgi:bifunctional UDP-N-acetylglucosamine pyrophosphorylase/glucosamine-1-phosphate N-acetyltransferase
MKSESAKVLHPVAGRPMLSWVLDAVAETDCEQTIVVVGHQADAVRAVLPPDVGNALQAEQLGTGHAAMVGLRALDLEPGDDVIVIPGDMPLVKGATLNALVALHRSSGAAATLMTVELEEPRAYGRIIREGGSVVSIVEVKDATPQQLLVPEVNASVYVFSGAQLPAALERIGTANVQGEYYLTDVVGIFVEDGKRVDALLGDPEEGLGVNSVDQIASVEAVLRQRQLGPL